MNGSHQHTGTQNTLHASGACLGCHRGKDAWSSAVCLALTEIVAKLVAAARPAESVQSLMLDLPDPLSSQTEFHADLLQSMGFAIAKPKTHA